jgi:endonuclease/exonuclease/phosphatase family metal-dependent hydrolase
MFGDKVLSIASYNVENLFDLDKKGYKYKEYVPNSKSGWNRRTYNIKLDNIARVIKDIDADIIALQEVHSTKALKDLRLKLKQKGLYYKYYAIADKKNTTIKQAILSKIPFSYSKEVAITSSYKYRNIQEVKFDIDGNELYIFNNHWKAKSGPESKRIISAKALLKRVKEIGYDKNIILLGDFNSDYEEHIKFKRSRRHNDTNGYTGINHILNTLNQDKTELKDDELYNLWYDVEKVDDRFTLIFKGKKEALDNMIISPALLDKNGIYYKADSMHSIKYKYLFYKKKYIYNWKVSRERTRKHKGKGYSNHLPIKAEFLY